jgi:hypothetical protein
MDFIHSLSEFPWHARCQVPLLVRLKKEEKAMSKEILVNFKSYDRVEDILPCLERVAQPGTKVTFLVRYPVDGIISIRSNEVFGRAAALAETRRLGKYYSWEENQKRAEWKVSPARETLERKGAEVAVDLYAGSLKQAIKSHVPEGGENLVMTRAGIGHWIASFLNGANPALRLFGRPSLSPVLLIQPRAVR